MLAAVTATLLATFLSIVASPVRVVDDGCPSGAEVELALASMISPAAPRPASRDVAKLERSPGKLRVELVDAEGVVIGERLLEGNMSCAELGRLAAVVIASWESDVHPEFVRHPAEPPRPEPVFAPSPPAAYDVAAGVSLAQADKLAAGGSLGASWFPRGIGLGLWVLGTGEMNRSLVVGEHEARWQRWTGSLELARRWGRRGFLVDAHGGLTLGWLTSEGVDFTQNRSGSSVSPGGTAGLRASLWASRHAAVWVDLRGFYFLRRESVYAVNALGTDDQAPVPRWGGIASIGVALGRAPVFP